MMNVMVHTENTYFNHVFQSSWVMWHWVAQIMNADTNSKITLIERRNSDGKVAVLYTRPK